MKKKKSLLEFQTVNTALKFLSDFQVIFGARKIVLFQKRKLVSRKLPIHLAHEIIGIKKGHQPIK